jgi:hypothetical protein
MTNEQIQAIGNFLQYYYTDLNYIRKFQDFKANKISAIDYVRKDTGTFYSFLIEFRVVRNFSKGATDRLLEETVKWINSKNADNVDLFANRLSNSNLTRGSRTTSLASKILFLNNPWAILPLDKNTRGAFKQNENNYSLYTTNLEMYRKRNKTTIGNCLLHVKTLTTFIEREYQDKLKELDIIRENRMIDKLLWSTK